MIRINTCVKCHQLFESSTAKDLCPQCERRLELKFKEVRTYVRDNNGAGLEEVSSECRVQTGQLLKWIREERLFFDDDADVALPCLKCGDLIKIGSYCPKCKEELKRGLSKAYDEIKTYSENEKSNASKIVAFRSGMLYKNKK